MSEHLDELETRDPGERERDLMARLPALVAEAMGKAAGWNRILAGVNPPDIASRSALAALPVTRKSDLGPLQAADMPFGGLTTSPAGRLGRIFMSPGPIFDPEGRRPDWWRFARPFHAVGIRPGHVIQNCFSYHFTPAAFMAEGAAIRMGCAVIPAGTGNSEMQVQAMQLLRPDAYVGTPSFLKIILEKAAELGADVSSMRRAVVGAEALPPSLRQWLKDHGVTHVLQMYGSADVGNMAYETETDGQVNPGMVVDEDLIMELVRPGTGTPVAPGEVGEIVVTSFNPDYPLIRFGTGDLTAVLPGASPCGRTNMRIKGWMGRADQTTKVRAMFVHPGQVDQVARRFPEIRKARLVVAGEMGSDTMTLRCELAGAAPDGLSERVVDALRDVTKLRGDVEFVAPGSLPNDGKVIEDARSYK
jgi:phenylacetate-CoA ligase